MQALGSLKGRLDLSHTVASAVSEHSSLAFVFPTQEVSGRYTCKVATFLSEATASGTLTVYGEGMKSHLVILKYIEVYFVYPNFVTVI